VLFPDILRSSLDPTATLTAFNASTGEKGLAVGLRWWIPAIALAVFYVTYLFRSFRHKVTLTDSHY
jgi:cytochrome d ubiquinol oxidase subunit II